MANLKTMVIGIIIFLTVFAGLIMVLQDTSDEYGIILDNGTFSKNIILNETTGVNQTYLDAQSMSDRISTGKIETSTLDAIFTGGFNGLKQVINTFDYIKATINKLAILLNIPSFIIDAILAIILFSITLAVIFAILGRKA